MIELTPLHEALVGEVRDLYGAEKQLFGALARVAPKLRSVPARQLASRLVTETGNQLWRLEQVFTLLDEDLSQRHSLGMARILDPGHEPPERAMLPVETRFAVQVERAMQFLAAVYSTAAARARTLGYDEVAVLLDHSADEALAAAQGLVTLAVAAPRSMTAMELRG